MTREERIKIFIETRNAVIDVLKSNYDKMDQAIAEHSYVNDRGETVLKAHKLRMELRSIRSISIKNISEIGEGYEQ